MARPPLIAMVHLTALLAVVAAGGAGCRSNLTTPPVDGDPFPTASLTSGCTDTSNNAGIIGCWYAYGDWYGNGAGAPAGAGDCGTNMGNFTADQCSIINTPTPGQPFASTNGSMCTSGTVAKVIPMSGGTTPDYAAIWGAGIGLDLNNPGARDGGAGEKLPWDATAHNITGFSFHIDTPPTGGQLRVEFPTAAAIGTTDVDAAYWEGASNNLSPIKSGGDYAVSFAEVGGPMYLTAPMPFDKTKILSIRFHVVANASTTIPFSYCISNLTLLMN